MSLNLTSATYHTKKANRDKALAFVNKIKDRQALAIQQELRESEYETDNLVLL